MSKNRVGGRRWRALRARKLKASPLCEWCMAGKCARWHGTKSEGRHVKEATQVDHIVPLAKDGPEFKWGNLQSLCTDCHAHKTTDDERGRPHNGEPKVGLDGWPITT